MTSLRPAYRGDTGETTARFRLASEPASMLMLLTPGADRAAYFAELAAIAASGRELSEAEWAEVFDRHDNVMLSGDERSSRHRD
jgi:hypothetical protein